ncbi:hypothetical protein POM88_025730 [Heracleum sosnowskyi]|uniref:Uncharacterized protein n=1 Tax=Heracleum sosnowskyi TaxID=360622 RepID=A0AAD8I5K6_9APIA|nr:hypothetical protein POM88_025730 [Heracleum sosnowskyi]
MQWSQCLYHPMLKLQLEGPKTKRNTRNDIHADPTKMRRQNTIVHCTCCKAARHNWRSYETRKSDEVQKAASEGIQLKVEKTKVRCGKCVNEGHNARACKVQKVVPNQGETNDQAQGHQNGQAQEQPNVLQQKEKFLEEGRVNPINLDGSQQEEITTLRGLQPAKIAKKAEAEGAKKAPRKI